MPRGLSKPGNIKDIRFSNSRLGGRFIGGLNRVNADGAIKGSSGEEVGITRAPIDLESPIVMGRKLL